MPAEPTIDYDTLMQDAMRGVVRTVLTQAAKAGLPGDHHFYVSFDTGASGVMLSKRLKDKYPHEMTIVLQHRFWDLSVGEDGFEVKLTFDGIPERLVVPFGAIKVFFDPSVRYGLQFEDPGLGPDTSAHSQTPGALDGVPRAGSTRASQTRKASRPQRRPRADQSGGEPQTSTLPTASNVDGPAAKSSSPSPAAASSSKGAASVPAEDTPAREKPTSGGAEIVSLDKFRKK